MTVSHSKLAASINVDRLWQELNQRPARNSKSSVIANIVDQQAWKFDSLAPPSSRDQLQSSQITSRALAAGTSHLTYEELRSKLQRDLESLKAPVLAARTQALRNLKAGPAEQFCCQHLSADKDRVILGRMQC